MVRVMLQDVEDTRMATANKTIWRLCQSINDFENLNSSDNVNERQNTFNIFKKFIFFGNKILNILNTNQYTDIPLTIVPFRKSCNDAATKLGAITDGLKSNLHNRLNIFNKLKLLNISYQ